MQAGLPVFIRGYQPHTNDFMCPVKWDEHGFWGKGIGIPRARHDLAFADAADEGDRSHENLFVSGEGFDAIRDAVTIFQPEDEYPAEFTF